MATVYCFMYLHAIDSHIPKLRVHQAFPSEASDAIEAPVFHVAEDDLAIKQSSDRISIVVTSYRHQKGNDRVIRPVL